MSDSIPILFRTLAFRTPVNHYHGRASLYVDPQGTIINSTYHSDHDAAVHNWAVVLDRKDPLKPALFNSSLASNSDVPPSLAKAMKHDSILFFMFAGYFGQIPQGALFRLLMENGAGAQLHKIERMDTYSGCGVSWHGLYSLVCVPGSGITGIENCAEGTIAVTRETPAVTSDVEVRFQTLLSLIPGSNGYTPVEVG